FLTVRRRRADQACRNNQRKYRASFLHRSLPCFIAKSRSKGKATCLPCVGPNKTRELSGAERLSGLTFITTAGSSEGAASRQNLTFSQEKQRTSRLTPRRLDRRTVRTSEINKWCPNADAGVKNRGHVR